jgi:hypothetical protein
MDQWVRRTPQNAERLMQALGLFGAPLHEVGEAELADFEPYGLALDDTHLYVSDYEPSRILKFRLAP